MTLRAELKEFILRNYLLSRDTSLLGDCDSLTERGILDSTGALELVLHLEDQYGIKVHDEELHPDNLDSIEKIVAFIERKRGSPSCVGSPGR
jgi:acyl carrier protein